MGIIPFLTGALWPLTLWNRGQSSAGTERIQNRYTYQGIWTTILNTLHDLVSRIDSSMVFIKHGSSLWTVTARANNVHDHHQIKDSQAINSEDSIDIHSHRRASFFQGPVLKVQKNSCNKMDLHTTGECFANEVLDPRLNTKHGLDSLPVTNNAPHRANESPSISSCLTERSTLSFSENWSGRCASCRESQDEAW